MNLAFDWATLSLPINIPNSGPGVVFYSKQLGTARKHTDCEVLGKLGGYLLSTIQNTVFQVEAIG